MKIDVCVPTLSDSVASGTLLAWRKQPGEAVLRDAPLVDLETDKVILEIPAPASGILAEIRLPEGAVVKAGEVVALIETGAMDTAVASTIMPPPVQAYAGHAVPDSTAPIVPSQPVAAPKTVRPLPPPVVQPDVAEGVRREPMSRLRQRVAARLVAAQNNAALLTTFNEVNMQAVNELRQRMRADFEVKHGVKLGYMSFFVRAVCRALEQFPIINASIDGDDIVWHQDADIGIAVSTPRGLVVPILRRAQTRAVQDIESAIADFVARAKEGRLALEELAGGTFSITNGGVFGSLLSTPIVNPPQSAILGMHTIQDRPVAEHGQIVVRPMMYLALSYDHRLIDGRDAVQFLMAVKTALETPDNLLD